MATKNRHVEAMRLDDAAIKVGWGDVVPTAHPDTEDTVQCVVVSCIAATPLVVVDKAENELRERLGLAPYDTHEVFILRGARYGRRAQ